MKKVESYSELAEAAARHFGRTTVTNCFIDRASLEREAELGTLCAEERDDALLIFRRRRGFGIMNFYLDSPEADLGDIPCGTVCEVPYRDRDESLKVVSTRLCESGFERAFTRVRLAGAAKACDFTDSHIITAQPADYDAVWHLMSRSFDERTGCLPTEDSLRSDLSEGRVLAYSDRGIVGLLRTSDGKAAVEIRHLAVDESRREEGIGSALVRAFLADATKRCRVWAREDCLAARRVYEKNGFTEDGMRSDVLILSR